MWIGHCKEIWKLTFRGLAFDRRNESRNCGLCLVYIQKYGATLLVCAWQREKEQNELVEWKPFVDTVRIKVHLTPIFFFSLKRIYLLFEMLLRKNFLIRINPRFSVPRRNLENSSKTPPCYCTTESEENGSSSWYDVYPGRSNIFRPLISLRMMQNIYEKCAEMPSRGAIGCCSNIPDLKKDILYNLIAMIGQ